MSLGPNQSAWGPNYKVLGTNTDNSHDSAFFSSNKGSVLGCDGPINGAQAARGNAGYEYNTNLQKGGNVALFSQQEDPIGNYTYTIKNSGPDIGISSSGNLNTSNQYNPNNYPKTIPMLGGKRKKKKGGAGLHYYSYNPQHDANMNIYSGSGYPEISIGNQNGGKKYKKIKGGQFISKNKLNFKSSLFKNKISKTHKKYKIHKSHKSHKSYKKNKTYRKHKLHKKYQKGGMYNQYMAGVADGLKYSVGGVELNPNESALANGYQTPFNDCSDPNGPSNF